MKLINLVKMYVIFFLYQKYVVNGLKIKVFKYVLVYLLKKIRESLVNFFNNMYIKFILSFG